MDVSPRVAGVCGLLAPASFVGAWAVSGALRDGYDPIEQAISQLAREGTAGRWGMTSGMLAFGVLLPVFAERLPALVGARALRASMWTAGVATIGVGLLPLQAEEGGTGDLLHAAAAGIGYAAMAASPALGGRGLARLGRRRAAAASYAVSAVSVSALVTSLTTGPTGLWQRVGLGVVDAWFVACAAWSLRVSQRTVPV